jgi:hypothetical protein
MTEYLNDNEIILKRAKALRYNDLMNEAKSETITEAYRKEIYKLVADSLENRIYKPFLLISFLAIWLQKY